VFRQTQESTPGMAQNLKLWMHDTLIMIAMQRCSLHFKTTADLCAFITDTRLRNFLLLGKKSILIATYTEAAIKLAQQTYRATTVETSEVYQIAQIYFGETAA
jgi:hypothetical protein